MKIILLGGSGFVGQGLIAEMLQDKNFEITSISRSGGNAVLWRRWPQVKWIQADLSVNEAAWQKPLSEADWVVDLIGVLFAPDYTVYYQKTIVPLQKVIHFLQFEALRPKVLFVSANAAPRPLADYIHAKRELEKQLKERLVQRVFFVYPGLIYAPERPMVNLMGNFLRRKITNRLAPHLVKSLRPLKRWEFSQEVKKVLLSKKSWLCVRN
ncbi:SDR family oxidoreductase [Liquorilactobacillus oeni]|uniref:NADH dehydrogenase n=1 Tax=Liquorilactobacillus oeni DSM 19972 TaxID=1423777 RepID=A0A0R1MBS7_9LACO|nr:SDR family oxidoreductase [Liquorilactobacillus oeni]KRL05687.1 NADH dehydrogenase [Liquorilactobacillus oeni DSM 19972]